MAAESTKLSSQFKTSNISPELSVSKTTLDGQVGPKVLLSFIPKEFSQVGFTELNDSNDYTNKYILGKVVRVWPLNKRQKNGYLQKLLLSEACESESGTDEKLTIFLFDEYAKSSEAIENGGFVAVAGFTVEPLTSSSSQISNNEKLLPIQLLVASSPDKDIKPQIWIARKVATNNFEEKPKAIQESPSRSYTYAFLNELEKSPADQRQLFNIFGIVQECYMRSAQANQNPSMEVILYDQTKTDFKCIIYGSKEDKFPDVHPGDIIRIHRLQVEKFRGKLKGKCFSPKNIVVFKGKEEESIEPRTVAKTFVFTDDDKAKIKEIREWAQKTNFKKLSEFQVDDFGNVICQIIGVFTTKSSDAVLLKVWDGTKSQIDLSESDRSLSNETIDKELFKIAKNWLVHIWIYGNYALVAGQLKPGQFVEISNAHLYYPKAKPECAKLCIHSQEKYGRGIQVLESTDEKVKDLKCHLEKTRKETEQENASFNEFTLGDSDSFLINCDISALVSTQSKKNMIPEENADTDQHDSVLKRKLETNKENDASDILSKKAKLADENRTCTVPAGSSILRDMSINYTGLANITTQPFQSSNMSQDEWWKSVATVSATDEHHEIKPAFLSEVVLHDVPHKFRVFVTALNFEPFFSPVQNLIRLYCPLCHYLSQDARPQLEICETKDGLPLFCCPNCSINSKQTNESSSVLEYIYLVSFLLQDGTAQLEAFLWRHHAVRFFKGIKPETILQDFTLAQLVQEMLWHICPNSRPVTKSNNSLRKSADGTFYPILDCCVMSYTSGDVTKYQIFDTYLL